MTEEKRKIPDSENGVGKVENGKNSLPERNEKGQFINSPGPGRPRKDKNPVILDGELLEAIEQVVRTGLGAKQLKDRLKAAGIGIRVQSMRKPDDDGPVIEPFVHNLMGFLQDFTSGYCEKTGTPISSIEALDVIKDHMKNCPDSPSNMGGFEEVTDDDL